MMPEVDGYITLDELKKHEATKNIPVIMMTAIRFELNKQLAMEMGAVDYITKPLHTRDLPAKVFQYAGV
jgi:DNA-binding response OmpR family regulator